MRKTERNEARTEARVLGAVAMVCYSTMLATMLVFGYTTTAFVLRGVAWQGFLSQSCPCF